MLYCLFLLLCSSVFAIEMPSKCPFCGQENTIRPIVYGKPGEKMQKAAEEKQIILGGCCVDYPAPSWGCISCEKRERLPLVRFRLVIKDNDAEVAKLEEYIGKGNSWSSYKNIPAGTELVKKDDCFYIIEKDFYDFYQLADAKIDGEFIKVNFTDKDRKRFAELTQKNINRQLAVFVLGEFCCAPVIRCPIEGGQIQVAGYPHDMKYAIDKLLCQPEKKVK